MEVDEPRERPPGSDGFCDGGVVERSLAAEAAGEVVASADVVAEGVVAISIKLCSMM